MRRETKIAHLFSKWLVYGRADRNSKNIIGVQREETRTLWGEDDRRASRQVGNEASVIVGQAKKKQQLQVEALIIIILFVPNLNGNDEKFKQHSGELKMSFFGKERQ